LLFDALIKYHTYFEADPRISVAIGKAVKYMWDTQWIPASGGFKYASDLCPGKGGPNAAPDLNLLIVSGFAWYARETGDPGYGIIADSIFRNGVQKAWLGANATQADKQLNENYRSSYHYMAYRR
jgi:hypothetical protein